MVKDFEIWNVRYTWYCAFCPLHILSSFLFVSFFGLVREQSFRNGRLSWVEMRCCNVGFKSKSRKKKIPFERSSIRIVILDKYPVPIGYRLVSRMGEKGNHTFLINNFKRNILMNCFNSASASNSLLSNGNRLPSIAGTEQSKKIKQNQIKERLSIFIKLCRSICWAFLVAFMTCSFFFYPLLWALSFVLRNKNDNNKNNKIQCWS